MQPDATKGGVRKRPGQFWGRQSERADYIGRVSDRFLFHPVVADWFHQKFGSPTEPQQRGWPAIQSGAHTLIAAPTGSGKTLAAFFAALDELFQEGLRGELPDETRVLYV